MKSQAFGGKCQKFQWKERQSNIAFSFNQREQLTLDFTKVIKQQATPKIYTDINIDADDNAITNELHEEEGSNREKDNNDMDEHVYKEDKAASWAAHSVEE